MTNTYTEKYSVEIERDLRTGEIKSEIWRDESNRIHRSNGQPAIIRYCKDAQTPRHIEYRFRGLLERIDGPAVQVFDEETKILVREEWYRNNERHRNNGPAVVIRDRNTGDITYREMHKSKKQIHNSTIQPKLF